MEDSRINARTRPSIIPPLKASSARMIVFFAAIVRISGKRSAKIWGSKNVSDSFAQSADRTTTTSIAMVKP